MSIGNPYEDLRREKINSILNTIIKVLVILVLIASLVALVSYTIDVNEPKPTKEAKIEN